MKKLILAVLLGGALVVGVGDSALAADEKASCVGIVISEHARWGDQPGVVQGAKDAAQANGCPGRLLHPTRFSGGSRGGVP